MPSHTVSSIVTKNVPVSHDLVIGGFSASSCYSHGAYIKSAKFVAGGRRWYLRYYPNGSSKPYDGYVTFLLYHDRADNAEGHLMTFDYEVSLLGPDRNPVQFKKYKVIYGEPSEYQADGLIKRKDLEQSAYLRDDAFSVRCKFCVPIIVTETVLPPIEEAAPSSSPNHTHVPANMANEGLIRFISDELPMDVVFEVGDETFRAHKRFLADQLPVFAAMFFGPMRENNAPSVRIHDMEPRVFKAMLEFIYRGNLNDDDDEGDRVAIIQHLLVAADTYKFEGLKSICAEKLRTHINASTVATTLDLALRRGCRALKDACCDFLAQHRGNLKAILKSDGFDQLIIDYPSVIVELFARVAPLPP